MTYKTRVVWVGVLALLMANAGCSGGEDGACTKDTIALTVNWAAVAPAPERLTVQVAVGGRAPTTSEVTVPAGAKEKTYDLTFAGGYPEGATVSVNISAFAANAPVAVGAGSIVAPSGCGSLTVVLGAGSAADGGTTDATELPGPGDGGLACSGTQNTCRGKVVVSCIDGVAMDVDECAEDCKDGACVSPPCTPGQTECAGEFVQTCSATGTWAAAAEPCKAGCKAGACVTCTAGEKRCNGPAVETCADGAWGSPMACTNVCIEGGTCGGECRPGGAPRCMGKVRQICDAEGAWMPQDTCEFVCEPEGCTGVCAPDALRCNGSVVETCTSKGAWQSVTTCDFSCGNGACVPKPVGMPGVAPTAQIIPATGAIVREGDTFVIKFSEEMNTATVEAAYKATTAGVAQPTFSWSADKSSVTVNPGFKYPTGSTTNVPKGTYAFTLSTMAKDANGDALAAAAAATYTLRYRRITPPASPFAQRDANNNYIAGNLIEGSNSMYTYLLAGYSGSKRNDGFVTFTLPGLAAGYILESAKFTSEVEVIEGSSTNAGSLRIGDIIFPPPLKGSVFDIKYTALPALVSAASIWKVGSTVELEVRDAVRADYLGGRTVSQFRLYLDGKATSTTRVRFLRPQTFLRIVYLIE